MSDHSDRAEELIAAAAASDLSVEEQAELDALRAEDPSIEATIQELSGLLPGLRASVGQWEEATPPPSLDAAIAQLAVPHGRTVPNADTQTRQSPTPQLDESDVAVEPIRGSAGVSETPRLRSRPRRSVLALAAAACVIVGIGSTVAVQSLIESPPDGPPGTHGAVEDIAFAVEPGAVEVDGSLIAHTWGTETVLEVAGLTPGERFTVVLVAEDGRQFDSGTFFGSEVLIECRMNAAIMRDDVDRVEITADNGDVIAQAALPKAIDSGA